MLEAGGRNTSLRTIMPGMMAQQTRQTNWRYKTVPQPGLDGRRGYQPRGRGLGGSSAINAMLYIRGTPWDYDNWVRLGATGWSWDEVLPVFKRAEANERGADALHGAGGPLHVSDQHYAHRGSNAFVDAAAALQIPVNPDFNGPRQEGVGLYQVTQRRGERWTAARAYLGGRRDKLAILTDCLVERVVIEDGRATGVAYRQGDTLRTIRARRAVVLAGGAFATPQLLMLSGIGDPVALAQHGIAVTVASPDVGANLHDHIDYVAAFESPGGFMGQSTRGTLAGMAQSAQWLLTRTGRMTTPFAEAGGFVTTDAQEPGPDVQFHFVIAMVIDHGRTRHVRHGYSCHACVLRPRSRGTVRLADRDAATMPLIDPAFLTDPYDIATLRRGVRAMYRILETPPLSDFGGVDANPIDLADDAALDAALRARADTVYHPVGTARMGSDDRAVCDPRLRVRGVDGLYVADASVMPQVVSGNTNAPTIMIGERCADFLRADLA